MTERIYPVRVKPASGIGRWGQWPQDVEQLLRWWNKQGRLTFRRTATGSIFDPQVNVFKCEDCSEFCEPHAHGAAVLDGDWLCDDCVITRARQHQPTTRPRVCSHCHKANRGRDNCPWCGHPTPAENEENV